jgi:hypothetical protein
LPSSPDPLLHEPSGDQHQPESALGFEVTASIADDDATQLLVAWSKTIFFAAELDHLIIAIGGVSVEHTVSACYPFIDDPESE